MFFRNLDGLNGSDRDDAECKLLTACLWLFWSVLVMVLHTKLGRKKISLIFFKKIIIFIFFLLIDFVLSCVYFITSLWC